MARFILVVMLVGFALLVRAQAEPLQGYVNADQNPPLKAAVLGLWHLFAEARDAVGFYQVLSVRDDNGDVKLTSQTPSFDEWTKAKKNAPKWYLKATSGCVAQIIVARSLIVAGGLLAERARRVPGEQSKSLVAQANQLFRQAGEIIEAEWPCIKLYAFTPFIPGPTVSVSPFPSPSSGNGGGQPSPLPSPSSRPSPRPTPTRRPSPSPSPKPTPTPPRCGVRGAVSLYGGAVYVVGDPVHRAALTKMLGDVYLNRTGNNLIYALEAIHAQHPKIYVCVVYKARAFKSVAGTEALLDSDYAWILGSVKASHPVYVGTFTLLQFPIGSLRALDPGGLPGLRGTGTSSTVYYDPDAFPINFRKTPGHVGLAHELTHAFHLARGIFDATPLDSLTPNGLCYHDSEELVTIGTSQGVPSYSENAYRLAMPWFVRSCHNALAF
jgi:hypothetical protein